MLDVYREAVQAQRDQLNRNRFAQTYGGIGSLRQGGYVGVAAGPISGLLGNYQYDRLVSRYDYENYYTGGTVTFNSPAIEEPKDDFEVDA